MDDDHRVFGEQESLFDQPPCRDAYPIHVIRPILVSLRDGPTSVSELAIGRCTGSLAQTYRPEYLVKYETGLRKAGLPE